MTCIDCTTAAAKRWHGFSANCRGCCARAAARMPQYEAATKLRDSRHRPYVKLLEQFGLSHEETRAAAQADKANKA